MNVIVPKLVYAGEVWDGNAKFVKQLETAQMTPATKILGCSITTRNTNHSIKSRTRNVPTSNKSRREKANGNINKEYARKEVASHS